MLHVFQLANPCIRTNHQLDGVQEKLMQEAVCGTVSNLDELYSALRDLLTSKDHLCMRVIKHDHFMLTPDVVASARLEPLHLRSQESELASDAPPVLPTLDGPSNTKKFDSIRRLHLTESEIASPSL